MLKLLDKCCQQVEETLYGYHGQGINHSSRQVQYVCQCICSNDVHYIIADAEEQTRFVNCCKQLIASLREVRKILNDGHFPSSKWYDLGLSLGLLDPKLKTIKEDYPRDSDRCLRECLLLWLQTDDKATWTKLVDALYEIEENSVAAYVNSSKNSIIE